MSNKNEFSTKIGLLAATVGSSIGLGNVWRFPAETQSNGGAAFLLLYIACVMILGIPVMLAELSVGRAGRSDVMGSYARIAPGKKWWLLGLFSLIATYAIMGFYLVVEGWTLEYLVEGLLGNVYNNIPADAASEEAIFTGKMEQLTHTSVLPCFFAILSIFINIAVVLGGVQKGIERLSNVLMPLLFLILLILCGVSLTLPGAKEGLEFFLKPDFSKITPGVFVNALGQAFFSLSLGMGILVTYAAYYPSDTKLPRTSLIVALLSLLVAILMGVIIFPAVCTFGLDKGTLEGATLVFVTLPEVFARLPLSLLWSTLFFGLLFVAALTSTVSTAEVTAAALQDRLKWSRRKAVLVGMLPMCILSSLCALSFSTLEDWKLFGMTLFEFLDYVTANYMLPIISIGTCLFVGWFTPRAMYKNQLSNEGTNRSHVTIVTTWIIRVVAPVLILTILIYNLL